VQVGRWRKPPRRARRPGIEFRRIPPPSVGTSTNPNANATGAGNAGLEPEANSFTEGQARRRIEDRSYSNVDQLHKDHNSIWQTEATKDGRRLRVGVDFRGDVVEENR